MSQVESQAVSDENRATLKTIMRVAKIDYGISITPQQIVFGLELIKILNDKIKEMKEMSMEDWAEYNPEIDELLEELLEKAEDSSMLCVCNEQQSPNEVKHD